MRHSRALALVVLSAGCVHGSPARRAPVTTAADSTHDLVIVGGRVMDPESGLDGIRNVAVRGGRIVAVKDGPVTGRDTLDARGLVVAPGFIDLHQHAQDSAAYAAMVRDGTTSALDLEDGTGDVDAWYAARAGRATVHYGVAIGHSAVRARVMGDSTAARSATAPTGDAAHRGATEVEVAAIHDDVEAGLRRGAVAVGVLLGDTPGARPWEVLAVFRAAADHRATVHVHVRDLEERFYFLEVEELVAAAASTGAPAQLVHINSSMHEDTPRVLDLLRGARARGVDVSTEAYPYTDAMAEIESAMYDDWASWPDAKFRRYEWPTTGERLTRASFERYRREGGNVIIHPADSVAAEAWLRTALADTLTMVVSDGILLGGRGHPRAVGTHARVLGRYVRESKTLTLMDAIRRMTLMPARRLESRVPAMRRKGRVQVGADADLVVFDPATVRDEATFREPARPPRGIPFVLVAGDVIVRRGALVPGRVPGQALRGPVER